jgi:hypothetical protein
MTTQYTTILKLALPVQGELSGSWGDVVNDNITEMVEEAVAGLATINSWTANSHTLTTANGTTSESRCAVLVADDDGGGNPSAAATIICPAATKLYVLKNISGQQVTLKTSGGTGVAVPNGSTAFLFCDGTNVEACQTDIIDATTIDTTNLEVTNIKAKDGTASGSIANSTGVFTINSAVLTTADINGGTIDGTVIGGSTPAAGTFTTFTSTGIDDNASSTAITIDSSQNVGIGTASPSGGKLYVVQAADGLNAGFRITHGSGDARMYINANIPTLDAVTGGSWNFSIAGTERMRIDSSGRVGIGTSSPASALTVSDGTVSSLTPFGGTALFLDSIGSNYLQFGSGTSSSPAIYFGDSADGDVGGIIYAHASNAMSFRTNAAERMRIDSSGYVGIGTASPARHLTVNGSIQIASGGVIEAGTTTLNTYIAGVEGASGRWAFATNGGERMRIDSSGNVGIGTSSPDGKLDIATGGTTDVVAALGGTFPAFTYRNGTGAWFHAGKHPSSDYFYIGHGATPTTSVDVVVDSSGNVGINTTSGNEKLNVAGAIGSSSPSAGFGAGLERIIMDYTGSVARVGHVNGASGSAKPVTFLVAGSEKMRIDSSGNVGIGATPSGGKLYVVQGADGQGAGFRITHGSGDARMYINSNTPTLDAVTGGGWNFSTAGTARMTISATGNIVMIPTSAAPGQGLQISSDGMANGSNAVFISMPTNTGNFISGNTSAGQKFAISSAGALSKTSGSFKIDHPLPSLNATHSLVHSFIEGPQADLIYRGTADLVSGVATVNIDTAAGMTDGTFVMLCTDVQCFTSNEDGWTALKGSVTGNILTITAQDNTCTDTVGWMVIGERCDPDIIAPDWTDDAGKVIVEPLKPELIEG